MPFSTHASGPGVSLPRPCGSITHPAARLASLAAALLFSLCLPGLARAQSGNISVAWPKYPPARTISTAGDVGNTTVVHIHFTPPPGAVWPPQVKECRIHEVAGHVPDAVITNVAMNTSASKVNECPQCYPTLTGAVYTWLWPGSGGQPAPTHNGQYTITATCHYGTYMPPFGYDVPLQSITVNLRDHIITPTQPQNPEPILWNPTDPVGSYTVPVEADIDQAYSTTNTPITLEIFDIYQSLVKTVHLDRALPVGTTHLAYAWDGSQNPPLAGTAPRGVYLFKWTVGNAWYYDTDCDKSGSLGFGSPPTTITITASDTGGDVATFGRTLTDTYGNAASSCALRVYERWTLNQVASANLPLDLGYKTGTARFPPPTDFDIDTVNSGLAQWTFLCLPIDSDSAHDKGHRNRTVLQRNSRKDPRILLTWSGKYPRDLDADHDPLDTRFTAWNAEAVGAEGGYEVWNVRIDRFEGGVMGGHLISPEQMTYQTYTYNNNNRNTVCPNGLINKCIDVAIFCGHGLSNSVVDRLGKVFKFGDSQSPVDVWLNQLVVVNDADTLNHYNNLDPPPGRIWPLYTSGSLWSPVSHTGEPAHLIVWWGCNTTSSFEGAGIPQTTCSVLEASFAIGFRTEWTRPDAEKFYKAFSQEKMWVGGASTVYQGVHHGIKASGKPVGPGIGDQLWHNYCGMAVNGVDIYHYRLPR